MNLFRKTKDLLQGKTIWIIMLLAFAIRALWVFYIPNQQVSDALCYKNGALQMAREFNYTGCWGYRAFAPPGISFLLAIFYFFGITGDIFIKLVQVFVSCMSIYLLFRICNSYFTKNISLAASVFFAIYMNQVAYCSVFVSEPFFTFLILLFIWMAHTRSSALNTILHAVVLTWLFFIKPQVLPLLIVMIIWINRNPKYNRKYVIQFSFCILAMLLWMGRNHRLLGRFVFATNAEINLYIGNHANATGRWEPYPAMDQDEIRQVDFYSQSLANDPVSAQDIPLLMCRKIYYLWDEDEESIRYWIVEGMKDHEQGNGYHLWKFQRICQAEYFMILGGLFLAFIFYIIKRIKVPLLFLMPALFFTLIALIFFGDARFHHPAMPFLLPIAAQGWIITTDTIFNFILVNRDRG
jgi:hypothetical protein